MEQDARRVPAGTQIEADVCIIGAGPTGITLARACNEMGINVLLLESGGLKSESWSQDLNAGPVHGDPYAGLQVTRHRRVGGSAAIWNTSVNGCQGAKYVPLDPSDFQETGVDNIKGWPIEFNDLKPYYRAAQMVCGLGPFAYQAAAWTETNATPFSFPDDCLTNAIYQFGPGGLFTHEYATLLRRSATVHLSHHATVCALETDPGGERVTQARIRSPAGTAWSARARVFVLAAGAIENTRLLLTSAAGPAGALGNEGGWLGRCFMEHPRDNSLFLTPRTADFYRQAGFYDIHAARNGTVIAGRLALTQSARAEFGLANASISLLPRRRPPPTGQGFLARLQSRVSHFGLPKGSDQTGWTLHPEASRVFEGVHLYTNLEQLPQPENRLVLSSTLDRLGVPRVELHWRWRPKEQAALERLRELVRRVVEGAGLGRVTVSAGAPPDPNAHHHAGTTRMSRDPASGVVDPDCRVHGMENLYVAGASVFPTAGYANPTLTCVAMALRLAAHLEGLFKPGRPASSGVEEPG